MKRPSATFSLTPILLGAAVLVLAVLAAQTRMGRLANLRVPEGGQPAVYVQHKTGDTSKCLVADRAAVTTRRSEPTLTGTSWKCSWPTGPDGALVALTGKQPAYLFVPFEQVDDAVHPWLYEAVREAAKARGVYVDGDVRDPDALADGALPSPLDASSRLVLPRVRWVQLWVERRFRGLFLEVRLPGKRFADARALGRVELVSAGDTSLRCWNRKLKPACALYADFVAEGIWPEAAWQPDIAWLAARLEEGRLDGSPPTRTFALAERAEPPLLPWPLPLSLERALGASDAARWSDPRVGSWAPARSNPMSNGTSQQPSVELRAALRALDVGARVDELAASLPAHCAVRGCDAEVERAALESSASLSALRALDLEAGVADGVDAREVD